MSEITPKPGDIIKAEKVIVQAREIRSLHWRPQHAQAANAKKTVRIKIEKAFWRKERPLEKK